MARRRVWLSRLLTELTEAGPAGNCRSEPGRSSYSSPVIPFLLLLVTALSTGVLLYYRISLSIWGVPGHWTYNVSFLCSVILLVAAYLSAWSRRLGFKLALVALIGIGLSFVPSLSTLFFPPANRSVAWYAYVTEILFYVSLVYVIAGLWRPRTARLFPDSASRASKRALGAFTAVAIVFSSWYLHGLGRRETFTQQMTWTWVAPTEPGQDPRIKLVSVRRPIHTITVRSRKLVAYLRQAAPSRVPVVVEKIYDHAKLRGWTVKSIAGIDAGSVEWMESTEDPD